MTKEISHHNEKGLPDSLEVSLLKHPSVASSIGSLLLNAGKISAGDTERILDLQKLEGLRFGDAAKALGLINDNDIQKALSYQFDFPFLAINDTNFSRELVTAFEPFSEQAEAFRTLRAQLMLCWYPNFKRTLAIASQNRGEGRSRMVANLAIVFSQLGQRTLLIDADLRQPWQHTLFKLQSGYGLSDILAGRIDHAITTKIPAFPDLSILLAGTVPPNPAELISRGFKNYLQQLQTQFDVILIDTPSAKQGMDVQMITANCGGTLLLARQHKTRLNDFYLLKKSLQDTGSNCLGAVLTDF
jgi:protein-tyrosine kinase